MPPLIKSRIKPRSGAEVLATSHRVGVDAYFLQWRDKAEQEAEAENGELFHSVFPITPVDGQCFSISGRRGSSRVDGTPKM